MKSPSAEKDPDQPARPVAGRRLLHRRGMLKMAGLALEWVDRRRPHHGVDFQLLKGASWFHQDPVSFRLASGCYAHEGWRSAFTGFRCALDGGRKPAPLAAAQSAQPEAGSPGEPAAGPIRLHATGGLSRHMTPDEFAQEIGVSVVPARPDTP